jgi:hypothetical protein
MADIGLTQRLISGLQQDKSQSVPCDDAFSYKVLFLNRVVPDKTNFRYFPAIIIDDEHANLFIKRKLTKRQLVTIYNGEGHVLVGKSCFINCLKYDSVEWRKVNKNIDSIIELASNILLSDLIQAPTLFPLENEDYQVLTGHRRFFALLYSRGNHAPAHFKVYDQAPLLQKIKQFQENSSREDLPQYGKLCAFNAAKIEIDALSQANKQLVRHPISVRQTAAIMGISMGAYDNYNVLTRYASVLTAYENGLTFSFLKTKKLVLDTENAVKIEQDSPALNVIGRRKIDERLKRLLAGEDITGPASHTFRFKKIKSGNTVEKLFSSNIMSLDTGINWDEIDWQDSNKVNDIMNKVIDYLEQ